MISPVPAPIRRDEPLDPIPLSRGQRLELLWAQAASWDPQALGSLIPWAGTPPPASAFELDPDRLDPRALAFATMVAHAPIGPIAAPEWLDRFVGAAAIAHGSPGGPEPTPAFRQRLDWLCEEPTLRAPARAAHEGWSGFLQKLARGLARSSAPESFLALFASRLGPSFWDSRPMQGFCKDFDASLAELLLAEMLRDALLGAERPESEALFLSRLSRVGSWLHAQTPPVPSRVAFALADASAIAELSWGHPSRLHARHCWARAGRAAWGPGLLERFADAVDLNGAPRVAQALRPSEQEAERAALALSLEPPNFAPPGSREAIEALRL